MKRAAVPSPHNWWISVVAGAIVALAMASSSFAQGKSQQSHGKGQSSPPSRSALPPPTAISSPGGTVPFAWMDDASLLAPGVVWVGISMLRWQGTDVSEVNVPVVDAAFGLARRVQLGASVPRVVGSGDPTGAAGGLGTSYFNAKVGVAGNDKPGLKVAVAPTLEILSAGAVESGTGQSRAHWGLPVSVELSRDGARLYGSTGYFSRGVWYFGAGGGVQLRPRVGMSVSFSRAWAIDSPFGGAVTQDRNEIGGGISCWLTPAIGLFGSLGHTVATTDENGAGMTLGIGMSVMLSPVVTRKSR